MIYANPNHKYNLGFVWLCVHHGVEAFITPPYKKCGQEGFQRDSSPRLIVRFLLLIAIGTAWPIILLAVRVKALSDEAFIAPVFMFEDHAAVDILYCCSSCENNLPGMMLPLPGASITPELVTSWGWTLIQLLVNVCISWQYMFRPTG